MVVRGLMLVRWAPPSVSLPLKGGGRGGGCPPRTLAFAEAGSPPGLLRKPTSPFQGEVKDRR
ncbi:hypothetical protein M2222_003511 [Bradyrhizobium elkanii]|jgi:hypothetical protein|nr:hypothetical protein [Bradyrhizobium elkanii]MCS3561189.1 hypothetical protein [Bradyrhizobium elkanii]MCW2148968.1 hypothetical protein [Bradyrhizobium elkanii]MCW2351944.1 hypothetical protein [Bradyrhizobium elkanii]MCW2372697.1 hypothetical protein [Bradyrhizobium elkanii]